MGELERTHELLTADPERWWDARDLEEQLRFRRNAIYPVLTRLQTAGLVESQPLPGGRHRVYRAVSERC